MPTIAYQGSDVLRDQIRSAADKVIAARQFQDTYFFEQLANAMGLTPHGQVWTEITMGIDVRLAYSIDIIAKTMRLDDGEAWLRDLFHRAIKSGIDTKQAYLKIHRRLIDETLQLNDPQVVINQQSAAIAALARDQLDNMLGNARTNWNTIRIQASRVHNGEPSEFIAYVFFVAVSLLMPFPHHQDDLHARLFRYKNRNPQKAARIVGNLVYDVLQSEKPLKII